MSSPERGHVTAVRPDGGAETPVHGVSPPGPFACGRCGTAFFVVKRRERLRGNGSRRLRTSALFRFRVGVPRPPRAGLRLVCAAILVLLVVGLTGLLAARYGDDVTGTSRRVWRALRPVLDERPLLPRER